MLKLRRIGPGYYRTTCGRYYILATDRFCADGRTVRKGVAWWNAGRVVDGDNYADDATFETKREAVARLSEVITSDSQGARKGPAGTAT